MDIPADVEVKKAQELSNALIGELEALGVEGLTLAGPGQVKRLATENAIKGVLYKAFHFGKWEM